MQGEFKGFFYVFIEQGGEKGLFIIVFIIYPEQGLACHCTKSEAG